MLEVIPATPGDTERLRSVAVHELKEAGRKMRGATRKE